VVNYSIRFARIGQNTKKNNLTKALKTIEESSRGWQIAERKIVVPVHGLIIGPLSESDLRAVQLGGLIIMALCIFHCIKFQPELQYLKGTLSWGRRILFSIRP
jgi:hypothetical protein